MKKLIALLLAAALAFGTAATALAQAAPEVRDSGANVVSAQEEELVYLGELDVPALVAQAKANSGLFAPRAYVGDFYGKQISQTARAIYDSWMTHLRAMEANGTGVSMISVDVSKLTVPLTQGTLGAAASSAFLAILNDAPELLYWVDKTVPSSVFARRQGDKIIEVTVIFSIIEVYQGKVAGTINVNGIAISYYYVNVKTADKAQAEATAKQILDSVAGKTDYEKVREFNRRICLLTTYDYDAVNDPEVSYDDTFQWINALSGKPVVCEGYAKAFKYLCDKADIACLIATGTAGSENINHMWNVVQLDGRWYVVDCTGNDGDAPGEYSEQLLAVGSKNKVYRDINYKADTSNGAFDAFLGDILSTEDYKPGATQPAQEHTIRVINGKANPSKAKIGTVVTLTANERDKDRFVSWNSRSGITLLHANSRETTFIMPDHDVVVEAIYQTTDTGSSGGSSGGGSSSGGSSGGGSGSGSSSGGDTSSAAQSETEHIYDLTAVAAKTRTAVEAAVKQARTAGLRTAKPLILLENAQSITQKMLQSIRQEAVSAAKGTGVAVMPVLACDTVKDGKTVARMYLDPAQFAASGATRDVLPAISVTEVAVEEYFAKYFSNRVRVFRLANDGVLGAPVKVAVKLDLNGLNTKALRFYTYDPATRSYAAMLEGAYSIDANGYLCMTLTAGGYVLVTDKAMTSK